MYIFAEMEKIYSDPPQYIQIVISLFKINYSYFNYTHFIYSDHHDIIIIEGIYYFGNKRCILLEFLFHYKHRIITIYHS